MSGDDELRRRLQEIPAPRSGIDVDAVVGAARRRRRPKVAALTAAATGAGVLIVAPFVAPGLPPLQPTSGPASVGDAEAPVTEQGSSGGEAGAASSAPESADRAGCAIDDARTATGLVIAFGDDPSDGVADVVLTFPGEAGAFQIDGVGVALVTTGAERAIVAAPDPSAESVQQLRGTGRAGSVEGGAGGAETAIALDVALLDAPTVTCSTDGPAAPAPVVWLTDADGTSLVVLGEPFEGG